MNILSLIRKPLIKKQADQFLQHYRPEKMYDPYKFVTIERFLKYTGVRNVYDITYNEVDSFQSHLFSLTTAYQTYCGMKVIRAFLRHFGHSVKHPMRPPHVKQIMEVKALREEGKTFRYIAKKVNRNISLVHRWVNYPLEEYMKQGLVKPLD